MPKIQRDEFFFKIIGGVALKHALLIIYLADKQKSSRVSGSDETLHNKLDIEGNDGDNEQNGEDWPATDVDDADGKDG